MIATGTRLKERYRLERLLGRGGMASVWLAVDEILERPVAIKVLSDTISSDPEFIARFRREARVAAGVSHPNLIGVYDYAEGEERPYLVMEHVAGENLAERVAAGERIDAARLARELLGALDHIHRAGIVHRDVKLQNVLLAPDGSAKLIDFGIALPRDATSLTQTGNLLGTARYIAPEVMSGGPATERSDLYSCGVVLRDCIGPDPSRNLRAVVQRLTTPDPDRRPASAREALARLERGAGVVAEPTRPMKVPTDARRDDAADFDRAPAREKLDARDTQGARRPRWAGLAALAVALLGLGGVVLLLAGGSDEQPGGGPASDVAVTTDSRKADAGGESAANPIGPDRTTSNDRPAEAPTGSVPAPEGAGSASGSALNEEGFAMIQAGEYEAAVQVLEEAVRAFPSGSGDLAYAYALFNLGNALRLSGRPEEAIPVLERRLEIPNQTDAVEQELAAARAEAE